MRTPTNPQDKITRSVYFRILPLVPKMMDLNNLINPGLGWELNYAYDINGNGDIVGLGTIAGETHAFLLTTVPIPSALFLFISGFVALAWRGRRGGRSPN